MICKSCCNQQHKDCDDLLHSRLYKSCDCQHRVKPAPLDDAKMGESVDG